MVDRLVIVYIGSASVWIMLLVRMEIDKTLSFFNLLLLHLARVRVLDVMVHRLLVHILEVAVRTLPEEQRLLWARDVMILNF